MNLTRQVCIAVFSAFSLYPPAHGQTAPNEISSCKVDIPPTYGMVGFNLARSTYHRWEGPCEDGLAQGRGALRVVLPGEPLTFYYGLFVAGRPIGYMVEQKLIRRFENPDAIENIEVNIAFTDGDKFHFYAHRLFLGLSEQQLAQIRRNEFGILPAPEITMPKQWFLARTEFPIYSGGVSAMLSKADCKGSGAGSEFCTGGLFSSSKSVYWIQVNGGSFPCPVPDDLGSCQKVVERELAPSYLTSRAEIERGWKRLGREYEEYFRSSDPSGSNRQTRKQYDQHLRNSALTNSSSLRSLLAEAKAAEAALEKTRLQFELENASDGQLFSKYDRLTSEGRTSEARLALRTLVEKYPSSNLAGRAGQLLMKQWTGIATVGESKK